MKATDNLDYEIRLVKTWQLRGNRRANRKRTTVYVLRTYTAGQLVKNGDRSDRSINQFRIKQRLREIAELEGLTVIE